ncbi:MAG: hypothetical protein ACRBCJ_09825 [Hyphomicrobiaceae bacterium]
MKRSDLGNKWLYRSRHHPEVAIFKIAAEIEEECWNSVVIVRFPLYVGVSVMVMKTGLAPIFAASFDTTSPTAARWLFQEMSSPSSSKRFFKC